MMKRLAMLGVAALVVVAAAAGGWWFFIREDNKLATTAPTIPQDLQTTAPGAGSATAGGALTFTIVPDRSEAAFFADEKLASLPLPSTARGTTKDISRSFTLTADGFDLDASKTTVFTVNLKTLKSDKSMRDSRVQNLALETGKYPTATFTATKVSGFDKSIARGRSRRCN